MLADQAMPPPQAKYNGQSQEEFMSTTQDRMVLQNGSANYNAPGIGFSATPKVACYPCPVFHFCSH